MKVQNDRDEIRMKEREVLNDLFMPLPCHSALPRLKGIVHWRANTSFLPLSTAPTSEMSVFFRNRMSYLAPEDTRGIVQPISMYCRLEAVSTVYGGEVVYVSSVSMLGDIE